MMLRFWLALIFVYEKDTGNIKDGLNKNCHDLKYFDNKESLSYSICEKVCITYDCKRCRMVCLSRECQDQPYAATKMDCRVHEFLSINCSKAKLSVATFKDNVKGAIKSIKMDEPCEFSTGFLSLSQIMAGNKNNEFGNLKQYEKTIDKSPWLFELKGNGIGHITFFTQEFSKTTNAFEEKPKIALLLQLDHSVIYLTLFLDLPYDTAVPLQEKNYFWIDILRLQNGSAIFYMGQGSLVGQETFFQYFD